MVKKAQINILVVCKIALEAHFLLLNGCFYEAFFLSTPRFLTFRKRWTCEPVERVTQE